MEIKEETEDRIVLADSAMTIGCVLEDLILIACGLFVLGVGIFFLTPQEWMAEGWLPRIIGLIMGSVLIVCLGFRIFEVLYDLLIKESVIIDKKLQIVITEGNSFVKCLNHLEKIRFIDIKYTEITIDIADGRANGQRSIALITSHGDRIPIYKGDCTIAEKLDGKFCDIIGKPVSHKENRYSTAPGG